MELEKYMRVVVVSEEPDPGFRKNGAAIPIGTTGTVYDPYSGSTAHPITKAEEALCDVVWDIPYRDGIPGHSNVDGLVRFEVFHSMVEVMGEDSWNGSIDLAGIFD